MKLLLENWRRFSEGDVRISIDDELEPEDLEGGEKSNETEYIYNLLINKDPSVSKLEIDGVITDFEPDYGKRENYELEKYAGQLDHLANKDGYINTDLMHLPRRAGDFWAGLQIFWLEYDLCRQLDLLDITAAVYEYNDIREKVNDIENQKGCI